MGEGEGGDGGMEEKGEGTNGEGDRAGERVGGFGGGGGEGIMGEGECGGGWIRGWGEGRSDEDNHLQCCRRGVGDCSNGRGVTTTGIFEVVMKRAGRGGVRVKRGAKRRGVRVEGENR